MPCPNAWCWQVTSYQDTAGIKWLHWGPIWLWQVGSAANNGTELSAPLYFRHVQVDVPVRPELQVVAPPVLQPQRQHLVKHGTFSAQCAAHAVASPLG